MLTSDQYVEATEHVKQARGAAIKEQELKNLERDEKKKRKLKEQEGANRLKETGAIEVIEVKAKKLAKKEEAHCLRAQRVVEVA